MPNKRGENQVLIAFAANAELAAALDKARKKEGTNRSHFIRRALKKDLVKRGAALTWNVEQAPDRVTGERAATRKKTIDALADRVVAQEVDAVRRKRGTGGRDPSAGEPEPPAPLGKGARRPPKES